MHTNVSVIQLMKLLHFGAIELRLTQKTLAIHHNRGCVMIHASVAHNALFWKSQTQSVNDSIYDFD